MTPSMSLAGAIAENAKKRPKGGLAMFGAVRKLCHLMDFVVKVFAVTPTTGRATMMIKLLLFLGIILSIVKANGWFIVPMPVLVFCWVGSFVCWMIYSYALGVGEGAAKEMKKKVHDGEDGQHEGNE